MDDIDKQIETLKVLNKVDNLNLTDEHYGILKEKAAEFYNDYKETGVNITINVSPDNKHIFKISIYAKSISIEYSQQQERCSEEIYSVSNVDLLFKPTPMELKHISNLISDISFRDKKTYKNTVHFANSRLKHIAELRVDENKIDSLFWLFREEKTDIIKIDNESRLNIIAHVFERKNKRYYLTKDYSCYKVHTITPEDEKYNYIDKGRLFRRDIFFEGMELYEIGNDVLTKIINETNNFTIITPQRYSTYKAMVEEEKRQNEINEHYVDAIKNRLDQGFEQDGIKFRKHSIEYAGLKIESEALHIEELVDSINFDQNLDFNNIFNQVCSIITDRLFPDKYKNMVIHLGSFPIRLDVETKRSEKSVQRLINNAEQKQVRTTITNKYLVDNIRINKSEIKEVIRRAICFRKRYDYDVFLKSVSTMSIKLHYFLANGVKISYAKNNDSLTMKLNLVRRDNKNYVVVKDKFYKVKNSNQLFAASCDPLYSKGYRKHSFQALVKMLIDFFEIKADDVITLMEESLKAYKEAEERAKKLLNETMKKLDIKEVTIKDKEGFKIKGKSGKEYFVERKTNGVYELPNMKYICIVETSMDNNFKSDKLVTYLYALKNDSYLASDIYTLNVN